VATQYGLVSDSDKWINLSEIFIGQPTLNQEWKILFLYITFLKIIMNLECDKKDINKKQQYMNENTSQKYRRDKYCDFVLTLKVLATK
jgi:hypothetical protein